MQTLLPEKKPGLVQGLHAVAPLAGEYVSTPQLLHVVACPVDTYLPSSHCWHSTWRLTFV